MVIKILSFLVTFVLTFVIVRALMVAVDIIGELPMLGFLNHCGGGVLGLGVALVIVWLLFLVLTLIYSTDVGKQCFELIEKSPVLTGLYQMNPLLTKLLSLQNSSFRTLMATRRFSLWHFALYTTDMPPEPICSNIS